MTFAATPKQIYTLKQGNKTLSTYHEPHHYVIGFKSPLVARNVHYTMHPEPRIELYRGNTHATKNIGMLVIPKHTVGNVLDPVNDGGYHMETISYDTFIDMPIKRNLGIILPFSIEDDQIDEIVLKAFVFDPLQDPTLFHVGF